MPKPDPCMHQTYKNFRSSRDGHNKINALTMFGNRGEGLEVRCLELPMTQSDPDNGEPRLVPITDEDSLTEALELLNTEFCEPYVFFLTSPKSTSGSNTYAAYIDHGCTKVYDTHPKHESPAPSDRKKKRGMCMASFPSHRLDLVANWVCSYLLPSMDCQPKFDVLAASLQRNRYRLR